MQFQFPFDATTVDPSQGSGSLPVGKHPAIITGNETRATNDGNSGKVVLDLLIVDGPNKGQTGIYNLNLYNASVKAVEIAQKQLSALCHVTGQYKLSSFDALNNIPFIIQVDYQKGHGPAFPEGPENKGYTEIKRVYDINGNEPGKAKANPAPQPAAQAFAPPAQTPAPATAPAAPAAPAWASPAAPSAPATAPAAAAPWAQQAPNAAPAGNKPPWG